MKKAYFLLAIVLCFPLSAYHYSQLFFSVPQSVHLLELEEGEELRLVKTKGCQTVSAIAQSFNALAAVNGGFFKEDGSPAGGLKIDGVWIGSPRLPRGAIGWQDGKVSFQRLYAKEDWGGYANVIQGVPLLISEGKPNWDYWEEAIGVPEFVTARRPRTAIGKLSTGNLILVVVDGDQPNISEGMTLEELTYLMLFLGCYDALNLDGGSSSAMVIEGKLVSDPAFYEKAVGDVILVIEKQSPAR